MFLQHRSAERTEHALNLTFTQRLDLAHAHFALHFYVARTHETPVLSIDACAFIQECVSIRKSH